MSNTVGRYTRDEGGFALAMILLALLALSAMSMAGYLRSATDYQINENHQAAVNAFYAGNAGLSEYMGRGKIHPDTVSYSYPQGTADVWTEPLIQVDDSTSLYRVFSMASHQAPDGGAASRAFGAVLVHKAAGLSVNAAITAPAGLNKNGASGTVDGNDFATQADCTVGGSKSVAGLQLPPGTFNQNGGGGGKGKGNGGGPPSGFAGNPAIDSTLTATQMLADLGIDWQGIQDGSYAQADYILSQDGYPNFSSIPSWQWPLVVIDASSYSFNPPKSGRGTLVIQGDATFNGSFSWDGVILIGGQLTSNGKQTIRGAVVTGLNLTTGGNPGASNVGNGNWDYQYHSCNILNALNGVGWPVQAPGSWYEVF